MRAHHCPLLLAAMLAVRHPAGAEPPPATVPGLDLHNARVVDLTHPFDQDTLYWPTSPATFELRRLQHGYTEKGYFYAANWFSAPEHGGTHMDAPGHFAEHGWTIDQIPPKRLMGPAVVIDVRAKTANDPDYRLTPQDIEHWETKHGRIPEGAFVIMQTGWAERWPDRKRYLGSDLPGDADHLHFPSFGKESAEFLVKRRHIVAVGVDTASIDYGPSADFIVHRTVGAADVIGLENLMNLDKLPASGAWVIALPMKIAGGSGAPTRIVALLPSPRPDPPTGR